MGPKLDVGGWMQTREAYRGKMFALADKRLRTPGTPLIQGGADDFASHLRPGGANFVVWPEDIGLFAALTGQRAEPARNSGSLEGAIVTLIGLYAPQNAYYAERYPALSSRAPQTRLLTISLTDTFGRVAVETFAEMADRYDVWLHAGVNMAQDWHVVCTSNAAMPVLPGGVACDEENPAKVSRLRDPFEPERPYAYEAKTDKPSNMALLFGPDGRLVSKQVKTYLTPIELPGSLDLVPGTITDGLSAVQTPVGRLGFVTSKDAWMPDVLQRLDQERVELLVQPEFFVNDVVCEARCPGGASPGMWAPDTLRASGYSDVLRHPSIEALVLPEMVGNVFNFSADAQQHIAVKPRRFRRDPGLVGQPPAPGLVLVMPWVVPHTLDRAALRKAGDALAPGSGVECPDPAKPGACENGHVEGVLWRDVEVGEARPYRRHRGRRARSSFSRSRPVAPSRYGQRNASVALRGRRGAAVWEERGAVWIAYTRDGGRRWGTARRFARGEWPALALGRRVTVALEQDGRVQLARAVFGRRPRLAGRLGGDGRGWKPALAQGRGDVVHAAWVEASSTSEDDALPQAHVHFARVERGRAELGGRLDTGEPAPLAAKLNNSWAPSVAARGDRVLVTWLDFLNYDWDVFSRTSGDGGRSFGAQVPVNGTPEADEALNDTPRAALGASRALVAWTDWRKTAETQSRPHQEYDIFIASPGSGETQVDPYGERPFSTFSPSICATGRDDALVAFQDASRGQNDIRIVRARGGNRRGRARRVDDGGSTAGNAWRPQIACSGNRVLAAWEDERDGPPQIYAATAAAGRLR